MKNLLQKKSFESCARFFLFLILILIFFTHQYFTQLFSFHSDVEHQTRTRANRLHRYAKIALKILNIQLHIDHLANPPQPFLGLIVCNHISYLDVLIIAATQPCSFITSVEIQRSGWIGKLCELAGCLFVNRVHPRSLPYEIKKIEQHLMDRVPMVLFPEATSSSGQTVLPFRSSLFEAAIRAHAPIHLFTLQYPHALKNVAFYGQHELIPHLLQLTQTGQIDTLLSYQKTLHPKNYISRNEIARDAHAIISTSYLSQKSLSSQIDRNGLKHFRAIDLKYRLKEFFSQP